ncbi:hypothetical protein LEP1GSC036_2049 [Leptospira weilii str. 2006001853]|uniref:Uncharacterized protein n=1 Tax=Leptospira weilii str. 2006001853 TaxID=1001589 RepID=A0A828YXQ5_9LEPT|nr:hypothetical protein LEP1GSC036_2049 [Leptospira weilii str. 2006001853]EMN42998.1 hypothetical protein LEP1GSC086_1925 [Leptospira weilii str. LNT 1234]QDK24919.1 hypothetical protein FHG67_19595 [Leptospira weilii]QDK28876.1 hypothetical protein FHG68_19640 [Leptospira weilii]
MVCENMILRWRKFSRVIFFADHSLEDKRCCEQLFPNVDGIDYFLKKIVVRTTGLYPSKHLWWFRL